MSSMALGALLVSGTSAMADSDISGHSDTTTGTYDVRISVGGRGGSGGVGCSYTIEVLPVVPDPATPEVSIKVLGTTYVLYRRECSDETRTFIYVPQLTGRQLAIVARDELVGQVPVPAPIFAPRTDPTKAFAQLPLWFWVGPETWTTAISTTHRIPGLTVTATARPVSMSFSPGDGGGPVTCDGPGTVFTRGRDRMSANPSVNTVNPCSYVYRHSTDGARVRASLSWTWEITFTATDATTGTLEPITRTTTRAIEVGEIQAVVTG